MSSLLSSRRWRTRPTRLTSTSKKKQIDYDSFTAKQRFNKHSKAQAEMKKKKEKESRVKSITSGYQHSGDLGDNFAFSSSEVSFFCHLPLHFW